LGLEKHSHSEPFRAAGRRERPPRVPIRIEPIGQKKETGNVSGLHSKFEFGSKLSQELVRFYMSGAWV
jgi:hypothetical protein